ncbi:MAG: hypothetical protein KTR31_25090 [Myxococcales bacterium]|nr:hypothetical protein [Myxococcales bacterium]
MQPVAVWRGVALFATFGWAATVAAWSLTSGPVEPTVADVEVEAVADVRAAARPQARALRPAPLVQAAPSKEVGEAELLALREDVRSEVMSEVEEEREARRAERSERRLTHLVDEVVRFAEEHDLDTQTEGELEAMVVALHERMESLRPNGPPGPPPPEVVDEIRDSFAQFETEATEVLGSDALVAELTDWVRPRPLRGR